MPQLAGVGIVILAVHLYLAAAQRFGKRVPEDLAVAGYDGVEMMRNFYPPLTTVDQDATRIGSIAADLLISQIEGAAPETRMVSATLVRGETVVRKEA